MSADNNKQTGDLNTKCKRRPGLLENIHLIIIIGSKLYEIIDTCSQTDKKTRAKSRPVFPAPT